MSPVVFLTPVFLIFEIGQLVVGERYLGLKQIERGDDPRAYGPSERVSFLWSVGILLYWLWLVLMLYQGIGQAQVLAMLGVTAAGLVLRRSCTLKWVLVILTFEGAIRIGMLLSICGLVWRHL
jgi:hypothetical protein